jgi:replicative DNA helicase
MSEHVPPHDLGAEQCVLGAMMLNPAAANRAVELLRSGDFYRPAHGIVFAAVAAAVAEREPVDALAIAARLDASGELSRVGGANALHDLVACVPTAASIGWYARIVTDRSRMRQLVEAGVKISQLGYELDRDPGDAAAIAGKVLADATAVRSDVELMALADVISPALDAIEKSSDRGTTPGLSTGIDALDDTLGGLRGGQLVVIAGRPGMGKSILGVEWARQTAVLGGKPAALFSLEMSRNEVFNRLISAHAGISLGAITKGHLSQRDWDTVASVSGRMSNAPLYIDDSAPLTLADLVARARRRHSQSPLALIVVDYLQLMTLGRKVDNRQQEVAELSRGLKLLAKELNCPVVAAAQLNRGVEMRQDKRPHLADLRESGAVEQDSDIVLMLYREKYYNVKTPRGDQIDLILAKHRNGPTGITVALADFEHARLRNFPQ